MSSTSTAALLLLCLFLPVAALSQLGPEVPLLAQETLTPFGLDAPDAVENGFFTTNPAANVGLADWQVKGIAELDLGSLDFAAGPRVDSFIQTLAWADGNGYWKVAHYGFDSNTAAAPLALPEGVAASFSGESWMLTWARQDRDVRWGVAWLPQNETTTKLYALGEDGPQQFARGEAESSFSGRAGLQVALTPTLTLGAAYSGERNRTEFVMASDAGIISAAGRYRTNVGVLGAAWRPKLGTTVAVDFEDGSISGPNVSESIHLWYVSAEQFLSPRWVVKLVNLDDAWGLGVTHFMSGKYSLGVSYAPSGFRRSADLLGTCDAFFLWGSIMW